MTLLLLFALLALVFSFLCSLWEAVLLSVSPTYATREIDAGSATGHHLKRFKDNIDQPLAAILTLNTIAHTVGAIGVGAQANTIWAETNPVLTTVVVPVLMTIAILVFSEIVPKTLGATAWQRLTPFTVRCLRTLVILLAPFVWVSQFITRAIKRDRPEPVLTRSDFLALAKLGVEEGVIAQTESSIIRSLMRFRSLRVADIMTPRTVVTMAPAEQAIEQYLTDNPDLRFSRVPIFHNEDREQIGGFVLKNDLLSAVITKRGDQALASVARELIAIPEGALVFELFSEFLEKRRHIALVVDEFGSMQGIVTMEDLVETLLDTEIVDELDHTEDMQAYARRLWRSRASKLGLLEGSEDRDQ